MPHRLNRRTLLQATGAAWAAAQLPAWAQTPAAAAPRPKVAALLTSFFPRSHAHVILENFLCPYLFNGQLTDPGVDVVSFYVEQFSDRDMARDVAREFEIPIFDSIAGAMCVGGERLAVDAVLAIGEHGDYPENELGQVEYPRKRFFDDAVAVMRRAQRVVPYFNDKHLSYRWDWAREMVDTARALNLPLMAGSSVPLAQRVPPLELAAGTRLAEALMVHGGPVERYDIHALEVLQSVVESRAGGEPGISQVRFLDTDALWQAAAEGLWSPALAEAAMQAELGDKFGSLADYREGSHGILLRYRDGLPATIVRLPGAITRWNFACRVASETAPRATRYYVGPWAHRNLFKALSHAIQHFFKTGRAPYPVERTLLTTGALDAAMHSRAEGGRQLATPQLEFGYQPRDFSAMREMGASWKIITEDTPERPGMAPLGEAKIP